MLFPKLPSSVTNWNQFGDWFFGHGTRIPNVINQIYYRIYFKVDNALIYLPVNPFSISFSTHTKIEENTSITKGPVIRRISKTLKETTWEGVLIRDYQHPAQLYGLPIDPIIVVKFLENLLLNKTVFEFMSNSVDLVINSIMKENYKAIIKDFNYEERGGEVGDFYYKITISEYKPISASFNVDEIAKRVSSSEPTSNSISKPNEEPAKIQTTELTDKQTMTKTSKTFLVKQGTKIKGSSVDTSNLKGINTLADVNNNKFNTQIPNKDNLSYEVITINPSKNQMILKDNEGKLWYTNKLDYKEGDQYNA